MFGIPIKRSMQKCRITSRRFSWKSTVEYVKANFPVAAPVALTAGITAGITFFLTSYAPLKEISQDTGLGVAISDLLPSKIKGSEVTTVKYDGLMEDRLFVERPLLLQQIIDIMN